MPKLDKRPRFGKLFLIIWSQDQVPGLKLKSSILTRRGAPAGTCPGAFWTAMCRDPWFLKFTKTYIICGYNTNSSIPEFDKWSRFWNLFCIIWPQNQDLGLRLAASILTRRGVSIGSHFDPHFAPDLLQNGFRLLGVGLQIPPLCCLISSLNSGSLFEP